MATGGPARALEPRRETESDTHTLARARTHQLSLSHTHRSEPRSPPGHKPAPLNPARPEPLPHWRTWWRRGSSEAKVTLRSRQGPGSCGSGLQGGFGASSRGYREERALSGAEPSGPGLAEWRGGGREGSGAAPALQLEFQMSSYFQIGAALY